MRSWFHLKIGRLNALLVKLFLKKITFIKKCEIICILFIMLVEPLNMNTSRPSLKYLQKRMCVAIAVDPTLGCGPPEVRPLLGDVFFLRFAIVWVIFTSRPSCDTTAISAGPVVVLSHPVQFSLLQITRQLYESYP